MIELITISKFSDPDVTYLQELLLQFLILH